MLPHGDSKIAAITSHFVWSYIIVGNGYATPVLGAHFREFCCHQRPKILERHKALHRNHLINAYILHPMFNLFFLFFCWPILNSGWLLIQSIVPTISTPPKWLLHPIRDILWARITLDGLFCEQASSSELILELGMRLFFICAYAVAVYADWYAHIRMKPHRKIRIVHADIRICGYADICICEKNAYTE